jgi:hypothetical protein
MRVGVIAAVVVACGGAASTPRSQPPPRPIATPPALTFSSPAASYNAPSVPPPSTMLHDAILAKVSALASYSGHPVPTTDEAMFVAATALASVVPEDGVIAYPVVEFAFQTNGVIEPSPHLLVVWGPLDRPGDVIASLQPALEGALHDATIGRVGVGAAVRGPNSYGAVVVALLASRVHTSPIPRAVTASDTVRFEYSIAGARAAPKVLFVQPDGLVGEATVDAWTSFVSIECGGTTGRLLIDIAESGDIVARFPVWCGVQPPRTFTVPPIEKTPDDPAVAERQVYDAVNRERSRLGRAPLSWNAVLAKTALEHSRTMQRTGVARGPDRAAIDERVRALRPAVTTISNVAHTYGVTETIEGMLGGPTTRAPLISESATEIGIGIVLGKQALGRRELYVTQLVGAPRQ